MPPTATDQQLAAEIHDLRKDFHDFRVEIAEKLGSINTNLEGFRGRTETSLGVARWIATVLVPIVIGLVGWGFTQAQRATKIEDSVASLGKSVEQQSDQVTKLIELQQGRGGANPPQMYTTPPPGQPKEPKE